MFVPQPECDGETLRPSRRHVPVKAACLSLLFALVAACGPLDAHDTGISGAGAGSTGSGSKQSLAGPLDLPPEGQALSKYVFDQAEVVPAADEERMNKALAGLEARTGHQFVVATVPNLGGVTVNEYSLRLARKWKIGRQDHSDGALLLLAPFEERVRVELGYGLECRIPDERAAKIVDDMTVHFREKDFARGLDAGVTHMIRELNAVPNDTREWARKAKEKPPAEACQRLDAPLSPA